MLSRPVIEPLESRRLLSAVSYYVAASGNDRGPGTIAQPFKTFKTIQHALNVASAPGDTIYVRAGTYKQPLVMPFSGSTAGGYITLGNYPGDAETETLVVNGNANGFVIANNAIHDCNNIGIDMIGGASDVLGLRKPTANLPVIAARVWEHQTLPLV